MSFTFRPKIDFEQVCNDTLESLFEYFDQIVEDSPQLDNPDITFSVSIYSTVNKMFYLV